MKGRHRSVANGKTLNASYAGQKGAAMAKNSELNSQSTLKIANEALDVSIQNTDYRQRSKNAKLSKLPHLMGHKQAKGVQNTRATNQQKVGGDGGQ